MEYTNRDIQILSSLGTGDSDVAFVEHQGVIYYSVYCASNWMPSSAVIKLLQGIFEEFQDHSFFILRKRIFTTQEFSESAHGMIKVVAKRVSFAVPREKGSFDFSNLKLVEIGTDSSLLRSRYLVRGDFPAPYSKIESVAQGMELVAALAESVPRGKILHDYNREIAAVAVGPEGEILSWGLNSNSINKTLHAEINLVQQYFLERGKKLPFSTRIYSTHKPCKMCAGLIYDSCEDPKSMQVFYQHEEKGSMSVNTVLDKFNLNKKSP